MSAPIRISDIAIIRIAAGGLVAIALGDSGKLEVGDYVVAIGNPFGIGQTVTQGLVGASRRSGPSIRGYEDYIQTDAPINPGNSGGALVNLGGELVGINTAVGRPIGGNNGIGFAIPVNMIREGMDQLMKYGKLRGVRSLISIQDLTSELAGAMGLPENRPGAVIANVETGSAAERAGLKGGDVITAIDEIPVRSASDLRNKIGLLGADTVAKLAVLRAGKSMVIRAAVTTPTHKDMRGAQINPLLEGTTLGSVTAGSSIKGVELLFVQAGSRAARAGLRKGDVITAVNQEQVAGPDELATLAKARAKRYFLR